MRPDAVGGWRGLRWLSRPNWFLTSFDLSARHHTLAKLNEQGITDSPSPNDCQTIHVIRMVHGAAA
jgi:hypothetical protein